MEEGQAIILGVEPVARRAISNSPAKPQPRKGVVLAFDDRDLSLEIAANLIAKPVNHDRVPLSGMRVGRDPGRQGSAESRGVRGACEDSRALYQPRHPRAFGNILWWIERLAKPPAPTNQKHAPKAPPL